MHTLPFKVVRPRETFVKNLNELDGFVDYFFATPVTKKKIKGIFKLLKETQNYGEKRLLQILKKHDISLKTYNYYKKEISQMYDKALSGLVQRPKRQEGLEYNYAYYPVVFKSEDELLKVFEMLNEEGIYPRRYFYPSLNKLPYLSERQSCPISEDITSRIANLPLYPNLKDEAVERIANIVKEVL